MYFVYCNFILKFVLTKKNSYAYVLLHVLFWERSGVEGIRLHKGLLPQGLDFFFFICCHTNVRVVIH